jgi:hypothetical protein
VPWRHRCSPDARRLSPEAALSWSRRLARCATPAACASTGATGACPDACASGSCSAWPSSSRTCAGASTAASTASARFRVGFRCPGVSCAAPPRYAGETSGLREPHHRGLRCEGSASPSMGCAWWRSQCDGNCYRGGVRQACGCSKSSKEVRPHTLSQTSEPVADRARRQPGGAPSATEALGCAWVHTALRLC